jgi:uncharacterized protein (UPF0210 family)
MVCVDIIASEITDPLLDCRAITLGASRVECYDGIVDSLKSNLPEKDVQEAISVDSETESETESATENAIIDQPVPVKQSNNTQLEATDKKIEAEDLFGKDNTTTQALVEKELDIKSIDRIKGLVVKADRTAQKIYIVYLENGQVWKQKKGYGSWRVKQGDVVVVKKASMGSFRMSIDGENKSVGATRLR